MPSIETLCILVRTTKYVSELRSSPSHGTRELYEEHTMFYYVAHNLGKAVDAMDQGQQSAARRGLVIPCRAHDYVYQAHRSKPQ